MSLDSDDTPRRRARRTPIPVSRALREVGENVSTWRKLRGLTQAQVAERADVSLGTLRRLEDGSGTVSLENSFRILRAIGVLDGVPKSVDPYATDLGRMRSEEHLPQRVRRPRATGRDDDA